MKKLWKRILLFEILGFALIVAFIWADEYFDFPNKLFAAPATPVNFMESLFESSVVAVIGVLTIILTVRLAFHLQRSNLEKERLLGVIAHDLRTPFTNLLGNTELLKDSSEELDEEERRTLLNDLHKSAQRTFFLLENLLKWAHLQIENPSPSPELIDIHALAGEVLADFEDLCREKEVTVHNKLDVGSQVFADPDEARSILQNLVNNAIKFSYPGGVVDITARKRGRKLRIEIIDQGVGLNRKEQKFLLKKNLGFSKQGTAGEKGSGIGLMLVKELVRRNGGKLRLRSASGRGSSFGFDLPRHAAQAPPKASHKKTEQDEQETLQE